MSSTHYEGYNSPAACSYVKLDKYNNGFVGMRPPVPSLPAGSVANTYTVPVGYGSNGYNTLLHGSSGYSGYPNIQKAYGACDPKYVLSHCGG